MMSETDPSEIDVEQFANETVRLTTAITGVMNAPDILTGEVSASGKTIAVEHPNREGKTFRLDTATIMAGDSEFRDSRSYTLYTREDFQNTQSANYGPGPQAGANGVSDAADLPEPTHTPVGEDTDSEDTEDDDPDADGDASEDTEDGTDEFGRIREGERVHLTGETSDGEELDATGTVTNVSGAGTTVELDEGGYARKKANVIKARSPEGVPLYFRNPEMVHMTDEEPASEDANPGGEDGKTAMTDGGEDVTEDPSAMDALRKELAASSDEYPEDPEDISDDDLFQYIHREVTDANGDLIIRFRADHSDGSVTFTASDTEMYRDYYSPTSVLMEYFGLTEGVSAAVDLFADAVDRRTVPDARVGVLYVDEDSGRVTGVKFTSFSEFRSGVDVDALEQDMVDAVNSRRDVEPEDMTVDELRSERRSHIAGYAMDPSAKNQSRHSKRAHELETELDRRGVEYAPAGDIMAWADGEREEPPEPPEDSEDTATDGGQREVPPEQAGEGDTIRVVYDSPRSDDPQTREGKILEIERWDHADAAGEVDTIRFMTPERECRLKFAPSGEHVVEQKSGQWTELGRTTSVTIITDTAPDGGEWDPEPVTVREDETEDVSAHARRNAEQLRMWDVEPDDEDANPGGEPMTDGGVQGSTCDDCGHRGEDVSEVVAGGGSTNELCKGCSPLADAGPDEYPAECQQCGTVSADVEPVHSPTGTTWLCDDCSPLRADGGTPAPSAHHAADALHVLNSLELDAKDRVREDMVPRILTFIGDADREDVPEYAALSEDAGKWTTAASVALAFAGREPATDPDVHTFRGWLTRHDTTETYDVKTVRVHEPERGRYVYVMVNRLDGRNHTLGDMGFSGVYFQFSVMSQSADFRLTRLSAYSLKRDHPVEWFPDSHAYRLISALDSGSVDWDALADEDRLTPEDVTALAGGDSDGQ